jgi:hypothetical protein
MAQEGVAVFPKTGGFPVVEQARADLFDSIYYADAVVGINTSVLLEAAIIGRQTLTVLDAEIAESQTGMIHFGHLQRPGGVKVARNFGEHLEHLDAVLARPSQAPEAEAFVEFFLRPFGVDRPATKIVADAIESAGHVRSQPLAVPWYAPVVKAVMVVPAYWMRAAGSKRKSKKWPDRPDDKSREKLTAMPDFTNPRREKGSGDQSGTPASPPA